MNDEDEEIIEEEPKEKIEIPVEKVVPRITDIEKFDWEEIVNIFAAEANRFQNDVKKIDIDIQTIMDKINDKQSDLMKDRALAEFAEDVMDLRSKYEELLITYRDFLELQHKTFLEIVEIARTHQDDIIKSEGVIKRLNETLGSFQTLLIPYIDGKPNMTYEDYLRAIRNLIERESKEITVETAEMRKELEIIKDENKRLENRVRELESRAEHTISLDALDKAVTIATGRLPEPKKKIERGVPEGELP